MNKNAPKFKFFFNELFIEKSVRKMKSSLCILKSSGQSHYAQKHRKVWLEKNSLAYLR